MARGYAGAPVIARRPEVYFRKDGTMPDSIELELSVPGVFSAHSPQQFGARLAAAVKARAAELVAEREAQGKSFLGREAVLAQSPFDRPASDDENGELDPKVACRDKWRRVEALNRVKAFLDAYRRAWTEFKRGVKDVVFPAGTYWMCRHAGCPAARTQNIKVDEVTWEGEPRGSQGEHRSDHGGHALQLLTLTLALALPRARARARARSRTLALARNRAIFRHRHRHRHRSDLNCKADLTGPPGGAQGR